MSRNRPDHSFDMDARAARRGRRGRRRRRLVLTVLRSAFWLLVLAGVFVLGLGYGRTLGSDEPGNAKRVMVTRDLGQVTATLPTETVVKTVTAPATARRSTKRSAATAAGR